MSYSFFCLQKILIYDKKRSVSKNIYSFPYCNFKILRYDKLEDTLDRNIRTVFNIYKLMNVIVERIYLNEKISDKWWKKIKR